MGGAEKITGIPQNVKITTDSGFPTITIPIAAVPSKPSYLSKTIVINVLLGAIAVLQYMGVINLIDPKLLVLILAIANIILRFLTNQPISVL